MRSAFIAPRAAEHPGRAEARVRKDLARNKYKYLMFLPVLAYLILFSYKPMYGIIIAFQNYRPALGFAGSPWVGLAHFRSFFHDYYFARLMANTLLISVYSILWGFPAPILFALLLNELRSPAFKRVVQTTSYLPHFISLVIVCSIIKLFSMTDGLFNDVIVLMGGKRSSLLQHAKNFRSIYVASGVWQEFGWSSVIYLAALTAIDPSLYEAARMDGAGRLRQLWHITLPGILPTVVMLFILRMGGILSVGSEKILLLYNETTFKTADVISTYTYRKGLVGGQMSFATAVGLFNAATNLLFLVATNAFSKRVSGVGLF